MASVPRVHKEDIGTRIRLDARCDISDATTKTIKYREPDGTTGSWTGVLDGTDHLYYDSEENDLAAGRWKVQLYVVTPDGAWHGNIGTFTVAGNIEL